MQESMEDLILIFKGQIELYKEKMSNAMAEGKEKNIGMATTTLKKKWAKKYAHSPKWQAPPALDDHSTFSGRRGGLHLKSGCQTVQDPKGDMS